MKKLAISLNTKSIESAIKELEKYKSSIQIKNKLFVERLLDVGITIAQQNVGNFGKHITFSKEVKGSTHAIGFLIATDEPITVEWIVSEDGDTKTAEVSPLLMAEFGSGKLAEVLFKISGVGRGTFPGQTHAFEDTWSFKKKVKKKSKKKGESGKEEKTRWFTSSGVAPTHPMYFADMEMIEQIDKIAREVFGDGI